MEVRDDTDDALFEHVDESPSFLVCFYRRDDPPGTSWSEDCREVGDATLFEVVAWAETHKPRLGLWRLGVIGKDRRSVSWVAGIDPNTGREMFHL